MKVIIVDDEPKAIDLIQSYLSHFSNFELVGRFRNGLKALDFLNNNEVEVVFLDINMPHLSGLSLSKMISKKTNIIFTTAYSEHAVESYDVNAVDYLLKPISLERFTIAVSKLLKPIHNKESDNITSVFIKSGLDTHKLNVTEIDYLEKDGNYMYYYIKDKKIMARESIGQAMRNLPNSFLQVQKSYIVNFDKITLFDNDSVVINGTSTIPIGKQFKSHFLNKIKSNKNS